MFVRGYRGTVSVEFARELADSGVYVVNALCVGGLEHLEYAYERAKRNFESGVNVARSFHMELMRILSGRRQIKDALVLCGVEGARSIVLISEREFELSLPEDSSAVDCTPEKLEYLNIRAMVPGKECDAFFENSAMVAVDK